jgi:ribosomal protein S28E/S33
MGVVDSLYRAATRAADAPFSAALAAINGGRELDRRVRREIGAAIDEAILMTVDAVLARLLAADVIDRAMGRLEETKAAQAIAQRLLDDGIAEQVAERVLAGPESERLLATAFRGPLVEEAVTELLETRAIWILVDEIARSPAVTEAITQQGTGFLDQLADSTRDRSRSADARVQRFADRLLRRRHDPEAAVPTELSDAQPT